MKKIILIISIILSISIGITYSSDEYINVNIDKKNKSVEINSQIKTYSNYIFKYNIENIVGDTKKEIIIQTVSGGSKALMNYYVYDENGNLLMEKKNLSNTYLIIENNKLIEMIKDNNNVLKKEYINLELDSIITIDRNYKNIESENIEILSKEEIYAKIEKVAMEKGIPEEILKGIAYTESNFRQFKDGEPLKSFDQVSYGIMQVNYVAHYDYDLEKLKYDIDYNINAGAEILLNKWSYALGKTPVIPSINNCDPRYLENWYFAIWAYNGWSKNNNPNMIPYDHGSWIQNEAYQLKVYDFIENQLDLNLKLLDKNKLSKFGLPEIKNYEINSDLNLSILKKFERDDFVSSSVNINLRDSDLNKISLVSENDNLIVLKGPILANGYLRYYIKNITKNQKGWVAMNWLETDSDVELNIKNELEKDKKYELFKYETMNSLDKIWSVEFNKKIKSEEISHYIKVYNKLTREKIPISISIDNRILKINPDDNYEENMVYIIYIDSDIESVEEQKLNKYLRFEFDTINLVLVNG